MTTIHLRYLELKIPGNERYLFEAAGSISGPLLAVKVHEAYPQLRDHVPAPKDDSDCIPNPMVKFDTSKPDKLFSRKLC